MDWKNWIERDPKRCGGRPVFVGTRVTVNNILGYMRAGESDASILENFPQLTVTHLEAARAFAARRKNNSKK